MSRGKVKNLGSPECAEGIRVDCFREFVGVLL